MPKSVSDSVMKEAFLQALDAILTGENDKLRRLLKENPNLKEHDGQGGIYLAHAAVEPGNTGALHLLNEFTFDLNQQSDLHGGRTPVQLAMKLARTGALDILREYSRESRPKAEVDQNIPSPKSRQRNLGQPPSKPDADLGDDKHSLRRCPSNVEATEPLHRGLLVPPSFGDLASQLVRPDQLVRPASFDDVYQPSSPPRTQSPCPLAPGRPL